MVGFVCLAQRCVRHVETVWTGTSLSASVFIRIKNSSVATQLRVKYIFIVYIMQATLNEASNITTYRNTECLQRRTLDDENERPITFFLNTLIIRSHVMNSYVEKCNCKNRQCAWFQPTTAVSMRYSLFSDVGSVVGSYRRFGSTYRPHVQGSTGTARLSRNVGPNLPICAA
jgi:hypothetical protein